MQHHLMKLEYVDCLDIASRFFLYFSIPSATITTNFDLLAICLAFLKYCIMQVLYFHQYYDPFLQRTLADVLPVENLQHVQLHIFQDCTI